MNEMLKRQGTAKDWLGKAMGNDKENDKGISTNIWRG